MKKLLILFLIALAPICAQLKTGAMGIKCIEHYESAQLKAYRDLRGIPTIGYGETQNVRMGQTITLQQAQAFLIKALGTRFEPYVNKKIKRLIEPFKFDALISYTYNCGYQINNDFERAINTGNDKLVAYQLMKHIYAGGKIYPGLVARRSTESILYSTGKLNF